MSPTVTEYYPDEPPKFEERFRGVHVLQRDENGMEKCVACFLCAAACPSNCIYIEAAENTEKVRISGGERYAKVYNIDYNRCIFCGYCVEACPTDAITHGHGFEVASLQHLDADQAQRRHAGPHTDGRETSRDRPKPAPRRTKANPGGGMPSSIGTPHVPSHQGTARDDFPRGSGGQERAGDHALLSRLSRHSGAPRGAQTVPLAGAAVAAGDFAGQPLLHGHRDPPRRHHRAALLHRSRHGRGDRRNHRDRRRCAALPGRDAGRNGRRKGQAASDHRQLGGDRQRRQGAGQYPDRRQRQNRGGVGGGACRARQFHGGGRAGAGGAGASGRADRWSTAGCPIPKGRPSTTWRGAWRNWKKCCAS